jgi:hypothetical protein
VSLGIVLAGLALTLVGAGCWKLELKASARRRARRQAVLPPADR